MNRPRKWFSVPVRNRWFREIQGFLPTHPQPAESRKLRGIETGMASTLRYSIRHKPKVQQIFDIEGPLIATQLLRIDKEPIGKAVCARKRERLYPFVSVEFDLPQVKTVPLANLEANEPVVGET